jgi:hypothetical protein
LLGFGQEGARSEGKEILRLIACRGRRGKSPGKFRGLRIRARTGY